LDSPDAHEWPRSFEMPVLMLMLITLLNDGTLISVGYDRVVPSRYPEKWALPVLFIVSIVLGIISCGSSLLLLWGCLDSWSPHSWFAAFGIGGVSYRHVTTIIYLKVSISDFLTLFSARCVGPFWEIAPSPILLGAAALALTLSTVLAIAWPAGTLDSIYLEGLGRHPNQVLFLWVWFYCIVCWFVQDACKVICFKILYHYNVLGIRDEKDSRAVLQSSSERVVDREIHKEKHTDTETQPFSTEPARQFSDVNTHLDISRQNSFCTPKVKEQENSSK